MKKVFIISVPILILLLTVTGVAQTAGIVDGHDWTEWRKETKKAYVLGMFDFLNAMAIGMAEAANEEASREEIIQGLKEKGRLITEEYLKKSGAIEAVDKFYEEHSLDIAIIEAMGEIEELESLGE